MPFDNRLALIKKIQDLRGSTVLCYLTSLRPNAPAHMADDAVRVVFDHLLKFQQRPIDKLDVFLVSNGGSGTVPWRLVSVFREFSKSFSVLIPYRAYSAASLLALGADEIVMHPFGELGPIDPTVSNDYNPVEQGTGRRIGISVEDVRAYVTFIKSVGISHEDELIKAIEILANKVHPLALGNVERFLAQSRMIATKIMRTHMRDADDHTIKDIVENMASKLYFHGHPINRREAKQDLKLKVCSDLQPELETAMWDLYLDYEAEFQNLSIFNPQAELAATPDPQAPAQGQPPSLKVKDIDLIHAIVESSPLSSRHITRRRYQVLPSQPGQLMIQEEILSQAWSHSTAPAAATQKAPSSSSSAGARQAAKRGQAKAGRKSRPAKA